MAIDDDDSKKISEIKKFVYIYILKKVNPIMKLKIHSDHLSHKNNFKKHNIVKHWSKYELRIRK